jgi:hypothetical protein
MFTRKLIVFGLYQGIGLLEISHSFWIAWTILTRLPAEIVTDYDISRNPVFSSSYFVLVYIFLRGLMFGLLPIIPAIFSKKHPKNYDKINESIPCRPAIGNKKNKTAAFRYYIMHSFYINIYLHICVLIAFSDRATLQLALGELQAREKISSLFFVWFFIVWIFHVLIDIYALRGDCKKTIP